MLIKRPEILFQFFFQQKKRERRRCKKVEKILFFLNHEMMSKRFVIKEIKIENLNCIIWCIYCLLIIFYCCDGLIQEVLIAFIGIL